MTNKLKPWTIDDAYTVPHIYIYIRPGNDDVPLYEPSHLSELQVVFVTYLPVTGYQSADRHIDIYRVQE